MHAFTGFLNYEVARWEVEIYGPNSMAQFHAWKNGISSVKEYIYCEWMNENSKDISKFSQYFY